MWMAMKLGVRNLTRRKGRTLLTVLMLVFGTVLNVFSVGMAEGMYKDMIRMSTSTWSGHFQVQHEDRKETPALYEAVEHTAETLAAIESSEGVEAATARLELAGLFNAGNRTAAGQLIGVDTAREGKVSTLTNSVTEGDFLVEMKPDEDGERVIPIVLGAGLADRLGVKLGEEVVFMGSASDGSIAAEIYILQGILDSGIDELDASIAMIPLADAQELALMPDQAHAIVGKARDLDRVARVTGALSLDDSLKAYTWYELTPELLDSIESDRGGNVIFLAVIILMVALGAINTMMMSVFERTREFGVMKALGTQPRTIIAIVFWESSWLAFIGVGIGALLGAALVGYLGVGGIELLDEPIEFGGMMVHKMYPANTVKGTLIFPAMIYLASVLGGLWPALRAARLDPVKAIREV